MPDTDDWIVPEERGSRPLSDDARLKAAQSRHEAMERRRAEKAERASRGVDYEDIVPMSAEERSERQPNVADIAANAAASASSGGNTAEIAAAVAAAVAQVMLSQAAPVYTGAGPRPISPAEAKRRQDARFALEEAVNDLKKNGGEMPLYDLLADLYDGFQLIEAVRTVKGPEGAREIRTRIQFDQIPNEGMIPKNESARKIHKLFLDSIGGQTPDLGDVVHDAYASRPRHPMVEVMNGPREVPVLGSTGGAEQSPVKVMVNTPDEETTYRGPVKILGTIQPETPGLF